MFFLHSLLKVWILKDKYMNMLIKWISHCSVFFSFVLWGSQTFFNPKKIELSVKLLVKRVL